MTLSPYDHSGNLGKMKLTNKIFFCFVLIGIALSGCAGPNGSASGNNHGVHAATDIFTW